VVKSESVLGLRGWKGDEKVTIKNNEPRSREAKQGKGTPWDLKKTNHSGKIRGVVETLGLRGGGGGKIRQGESQGKIQSSDEKFV